ncbi:Uncharacterised protein [Candidatus Bilamarchaeum dharawalense]|uniref:DUF350 domain-containing protein n=1 Tax=Candidatus Bilamarchaeum dharawalense TaxID=2885759 RepID=A0A5E4LXJ2_9ARCH|nr:Uncharacterised protein [Candidatus Bilamarchaeum dharawalense]
MIQNIIVYLMLAIVKIVAAIALSANAAYMGMSLLDRVTSQIDEWKEIKKGNVAVGILYAASILSLIILVEPQIFGFVNAIQFEVSAQYLLGTLAFALANYFVAILIGIIVIYLSIHVVDKLTPDLEELKELKKGNVAVAIVMAVVLISIAFALRGPFESVFETISSLESLIL